MLSNEKVRSMLHVGYTFVLKGVHHTILSLHRYKLYCRTFEGRTYYMTYAYFQTTNHFKSRYLMKRGVGISK